MPIVRKVLWMEVDLYDQGAIGLRHTGSHPAHSKAKARFHCRHVKHVINGAGSVPEHGDNILLGGIRSQGSTAWVFGLMTRDFFLSCSAQLVVRIVCAARCELI